MSSPSNGVVASKRKDSHPATSPTTLKKRRVLEERSQNIHNPPPSRGPKSSSQNIKSSFEEDLNRLTQEIGEVGDSNLFLEVMTDMIAPFETDQKWARPPVKSFDATVESLSMNWLRPLLMTSVSTNRV
jgi:hypothetical protein